MGRHTLCCNFRYAIHGTYNPKRDSYAISIWTRCHIKFDLRSKLATNKRRKQALIKKNNIRKNNKRIKHIYNIGDLVLLKKNQITKYGQNAYQGP